MMKRAIMATAIVASLSACDRSGYGPTRAEMDAACDAVLDYPEMKSMRERCAIDGYYTMR